MTDDTTTQDAPGSPQADEPTDATDHTGDTTDAPHDAPGDDQGAPDAPTVSAFQPDARRSTQVGLDPALRAARDAQRAAESDVTPVRAADRRVEVVDPDGRLAAAKRQAQVTEGIARDVRDGPPSV